MVVRRVLFCGGGIRVIAHIGALEEMSRHRILATIQEWAGVSAGALVAMCLAVGYTIDELRDFCLRFDFHNAMELDSAPGWLIHMGLDTGERLTRMIEACLHVKGLSSDITFRQCQQKFQTALRVFATDLKQGTLAVFSPSSTPDYTIAHAVRASMSFPYYFQPFEDSATGTLYSDGGVVSNYPFYTLSPQEQEETIGLLFDDKCPEMATADFELEQAFLRPIKILLYTRTAHEKEYAPSRTIIIDTFGVDAFDVGLSYEVKLSLLQSGVASVKAHVQKMRAMPKRRYSVG